MVFTWCGFYGLSPAKLERRETAIMPFHPSCIGPVDRAQFRHGMHGGAKIWIGPARNRAKHGRAEQNRFRRCGCSNDEASRIGQHLTNQIGSCRAATDDNNGGHDAFGLLRLDDLPRSITQTAQSGEIKPSQTVDTRIKIKPGNDGAGVRVGEGCAIA